MFDRIDDVRELLATVDQRAAAESALDELVMLRMAVADVLTDVRGLQATIDSRIAQMVDRSARVNIAGVEHDVIVSRSTVTKERWDHAAVVRDVIAAVGGDLESLAACLPDGARWSAPRLRAQGLNPELYREQERVSRVSIRVVATGRGGVDD